MSVQRSIAGAIIAAIALAVVVIWACVAFAVATHPTTDPQKWIFVVAYAIPIFLIPVVFRRTMRLSESRLTWFIVGNLLMFAFCAVLLYRYSPLLTGAN
jgi:hypothetical protein